MANTAAQLERQKRYRESHREELRAKGREYQAQRRADDPDYAEGQRERIRRLTREQPEYLSEIRRRSYAKHATRRRLEKAEGDLRRLYGLSVEDLERLYLEQDGRCAICRESVALRDGPQGMHVDHCHRSGRVRGLLCPRCNHGIAKFSDDPYRLRMAAAYLEGSNG